MVRRTQRQRQLMAMAMFKASVFPQGTAKVESYWKVQTKDVQEDWLNRADIALDYLLEQRQALAMLK